MGDNKRKRKNKPKKKQRDQNNSDNVNLVEENLDQADEELQTDERVESSEILKRTCNEEESESETEPKKKKKKKKAVVPENTTSDKNKKSNRQKKKEKHAQRQAEMQAVAKDQLKSQCLNYLSQWKHNKSNWKFMKAKQVWLFKNKFSQNLLSNESWPLLLEYFESAQGNIRNMLLEDANKIIKQMDEWTESHDKGEENEESESPTESKKPNETVYKRARELIQCLQE